LAERKVSERKYQETRERKRRAYLLTPTRVPNRNRYRNIKREREREKKKKKLSNVKIA
tara:strand:+ start:801 stop:974 length:174 start_codon:yes stop_codon:yes gene_type:complete